VDLLSRAATRLRQQGRLGLLAQVLTMSVLDNLEVGDWDRAAVANEEARRLTIETGQPVWGNSSLALSAMLAALRGDAGRAQELATAAERAAGDRRLGDLLACVQLSRGFALISNRQYEEAYAALRRLFDPADPAFHPSERFHGVMFLAEAAVQAGRTEDTRAVLATLEAEAGLTPAPTLHRQLSYAQAVLASDEVAGELFRDALQADLIRWPWLRARLELAYGQWLRRQRRGPDARSPLRSALITFDLVGAKSWAEIARSELRASGELVQPEARKRLSALSEKELEIARLAAQGLSNREIGERLFLSPRTVGSHLYRIFPKLGITARAQLAAALGPSQH
jgi:DNA-binding CsgD family transcriptional regulator